MKCLLLANTAHRLFHDAKLVANAHFSEVEVIDHKDDEIDDETLKHMQADVLVSFLSERILRESHLRRPNVNLHPAPPKYPGRGGASFAIYNGDVNYGATCHVMTGKVDAGPILFTHSFPIYPADTCETIFAKAERACVDLFDVFASQFIAKNGKMPEPNGQQWTGKAVSRAEFQKWLEINPELEDDAKRKLRAARHSRYSGPYIKIAGETFARVPG